MAKTQYNDKECFEFYDILDEIGLFLYKNYSLDYEGEEKEMCKAIVQCMDTHPEIDRNQFSFPCGSYEAFRECVLNNDLPTIPKPKVISWEEHEATLGKMHTIHFCHRGKNNEIISL